MQLFIYFSFGKLMSQHSLLNHLCHSVCARLCNNDVFLSFSSCPSQWTGNRCQEQSFTPTTSVIPDSKLGNWMGKCLCSCLNINVLFYFFPCMQIINNIYLIHTICVILNSAAVSVGLSVTVILVVIATGVILFWLFQKRHSQK